MTIEDRLREALRRRTGDGHLPDGFVARLIRDLPAREPRRSAWLRPARGVVSAVTLVVVVALLLAVARPDLLGGNPGPSAIRSQEPTVRGSAAALGTTQIPAVNPGAGPTMTPGPTATGPSSARYDDGIPREFDGQPVLHGLAAVSSRLKAVPDMAPFLVGGWVRVTPPDVPMSCPALAGTTWLNSCRGPWFAFLAGTSAFPLAVPITFHFVTGPPSTGPVVVKVHVHDPRAPECGAQAPACAQAMVVERILWTGDSATDPRPLTIGLVRQVLAPLDPGLTLDDDRMAIGGCDAESASAVSYEANRAPASGPAVLSVAIEPSTVARERSLGQAPGAAAALASGWRPRGPICGESGTGAGGKTTWVAYRALAVANVVVSVQTSITLTAADQSFVERLASGLERAAGGG